MWNFKYNLKQLDPLYENAVFALNGLVRITELFQAQVVFLGK